MIGPDRHPPMAPWLEQAWLMRYLDRQLGADEQAWFEGYLLDKPDLLEQVEADTALRDAVAAQRAGVDAAPAATGLRAVAGPGAASGGTAGDADSDSVVGRANDASSSATATSTDLRQGRRRGVRGGWLALAASFAGGIGLAALGIGLLDDRGTGLVANPPRIIFDTLRGELTAPRVEAGDPASPIMLVEFPVPSGGSIRSARASGGGVDYALPVPTVSPDGFATYVVPSRWRGQVTLTIEIDRAGAAPLTLDLEIDG